MNSIEKLQTDFNTFLAHTFTVDQTTLNHCTLSLNADENKQQFGDLSTNAPMILAKQLKQNPRALAERIADSFKSPLIEKTELAGPGFLNFYLNQQAHDHLAQELFSGRDAFFKPYHLHKEKINIEFVSANPTGPLHFGHGRGGIIGDVLAEVLSFIGHDVTKEFYINDAGSQIQKLGNSLKIRYQQLSGIDASLPEDGYQGEYLVAIARELQEAHGNTLLNQPESFFGELAKVKLLAAIKSTLHDYGITFDLFFSEKTLHDSGKIEKAIQQLKKDGHLFEQDGALWFHSTAFGDDKDRVVKKQNGELTYAAADIAYMQDKIDRGFNHLIYILGHDHHSYATRLQGLLKALGHTETPLNVILYQLVKMKEGGEQMRMSKRKGNIVTLQDIIDTVGKDVARFFYLNRKADAQLEFDIDLALKNSEENPVYYIQYAYVRTGSILEKAHEEKSLATITANDLKHLSPADIMLVKKIASLKETLQAIGHNQHTHLLAYYTHELAQFFNKYYGKNRVIELENIPQSRARLALILIMRHTLGLCLDLLGLSKPERM